MPVLAAALLGPATIAYIGLAIRVHGWPANRVIEHAMQSHAGSLVLAGVLGVVAMAAVLFRRMRAPTMSVPMGVVAVTAIIIAALTKSDVATAVAAIAGIIAINTRTLRIERAWIETDDPAAGTELFALIKRRLADARRLLVAHYRAVALAIVVLALGFTGHVPTDVPLNSEPPTLAATFHRAIQPTVVVEPANQAAVPAPEPTPPHVRRLSYGVIEVEVTFSGSDVTVPTGITIPPGWDSRVEAHVDYERSTAGEYDIDGFGHFTAAYPFQVITPTVCATERAQPLNLAIHAGAGTHHIVIVIRPSLTAAGC
jgi:hypothetical protein